MLMHADIPHVQTLYVHITQYIPYTHVYHTVLTCMHTLCSLLSCLSLFVFFLSPTESRYLHVTPRTFPSVFSFCLFMVCDVICS